MAFKQITSYQIPRNTPIEEVLNHLEVMKDVFNGVELRLVCGTAVFTSPSTESVDQVRYRLMKDPSDLMRPLLSHPGHEIRVGDIVEVATNDHQAGLFAGDKGVVRWADGKRIAVHFGTAENTYAGDELAKLRHFARS